MTVMIQVELPDDLAGLRLPPAVAERLQTLLTQQDAGRELSRSERAEAEGLVNLAELLAYLRLRAK